MISDFNSDKAKRARLPSILLTNLRSINNKFDDLRCQVSTYNPDIVICTETWLAPFFPNQAFTIPGYVCYRADRINGSVGGGVAIWSKVCLCAEDLQFQTSEDIELCCVKLPHCKLIIIGVYLPPGLRQAVFQEFRNKFCDTLDSVLLRLPQYRPIVAGDFNRYNCAFLSNIFSLTNIVTEPTRLDATLDLVFVDASIKQRYPSQNVEVGPPIGSSDHNTVMVFPSNAVNCRASRKHIFYDLRLSHVLAFERQFLNHCELPTFYALTDVDQKCDCFFRVMIDSMRVIPQHVVYLTDSDAPWFTPFLKHLVNKRWEAFRSHDWQMYNYLKIKVKSEIFKAKNNYFQKKRSTVKGLWSYVNMERGSNDNAQFDLLTKNSPIKTVLNRLNEHFSSAMNTQSAPADLSNFEDDGWMPSFTAVDVWQILSRLKSKATGSDDIPTILYKKSALILAEPIFHLIKACLQQRRFPLAWKIADLVPVPKSSKVSLTNFRPISLLPIPAKVAEQIILRDVRLHLSSCFGDNQFGIRKMSSTTHAIIAAHECLTRLSDDPDIGASVLISFDFSKAFDKISHQFLVSRAMELNLPSGFVIFLENYFCQRKQCVRMHGQRSDFNVMTSGVPQGSLLGPYLFGIFISTLRPLFSTTSMIKYVDDVYIIAGIRKDHSTCDAEKVSREIVGIRQWSSSNCMTLNSEKTSGLVKYCGNFKESFNVEAHISVVHFQPSLRFLGVLFDNSFGWSSHVNYIERKCAQRMYILRRIQCHTSYEEFVTVYISLIRTLIEYAAPAFIGLSAGDQRRLQMIQNRCMRIKEGVVLPKLSDRRWSLAMNLFRKIPFTDTFLRTLLPSSLPSGRLCVPFCRTSLRRTSFIPCMSIVLSRSFYD